MESEGIKAYRQTPAEVASTASELHIPNLSAHSHFAEVPSLPTEAQALPTAVNCAQSAPRSISEEEGRILPTVPLNQVPVAIQQMLTSAPNQVMQSEPAEARAALPEAAAAAETQHSHAVFAVPAQGEGMARDTLPAGITGPIRQDDAVSDIVTRQSHQNVVAIASVDGVMPEDSLGSHGEHTDHLAGVVASKMFFAVARY